MHRRKQELKIRISVTCMWNSIYSTTSDFWSFTFLGRYVILGNKRYRHSGKVKQILFDFLRHKLNSGYKGNKAWQKCKNKTFSAPAIGPSLRGRGVSSSVQRGGRGGERGTRVDDLAIIFHYHTPSLRPAGCKEGRLTVTSQNHIPAKFNILPVAACVQRGFLSTGFFHLWKKIRIFWRMIKRKLLIHHNWRCSKFAKS